MSFRNLSLLALVFALGCSKGANAPNGGSNIVLKVGSTQCLQGIGAEAESFFKGTGSATDMHNVWACLSQVVQNFDILTVGANPSQYSATELKGFLVKYFFPGGLSDAAVTSTMQLKQVLVGGSNTSITKAEIGVLVANLARLDSITAALAPHMQIIFNAGNTTVSDARWMQAYQTLNAMAPQIGQIVGEGNQICTLTDLQTLITAWADQLNIPSSNFFREIGTMIPSIGEGKAILVGGSATSVQPSEWPTLFAALGNSYSYYRMGARLAATPGDMSLALQSPNVEWAIGGIVNIISQAVQARPNQQIPLTEVQTVLTNINTLGYFPKSVTPAQVMTALQFFLGKLFPGTSSSGTAIDQGHVNAMQSFVSRWQTVEKAIEQGNFSGLTDLDNSLHPGWLMPLDSLGRLEVPPVSNATQFREYSAIYTLDEWLGNQWGTWPLSGTQFQTLVSDALNLLHSFNLLTTTDSSVYTKLLREANLFMPSSDGDMLLELPEAFQYVLYALSSYRSSHGFVATVGNQCATTDYACFQNILTANRAALLGNFPHLNTWMLAHPDEWTPFLQDMTDTVGQGEWLEEFQAMSYVETFLQRWDANHDQLIEMSEALNAFTVYGPVLLQALISDGVSADDVKPTFTFLFKYGQTPAEMFGGKVRYLNWKWNEDSWDSAADRKTLADILADLSKM